jgi:hypothetical protein
MVYVVIAGFGIAVVLLVAVLVAVRGIRIRIAALESGLAGIATREMVDALPAKLAPAEDLRPELAELRRSVERVQGALQALSIREAAPPAVLRVGEEVEPLLREAMESLDGRLREILGTLAADRQEELGFAEVMKRGLADLGYGQVRIVAGPDWEGERILVRVEAKREGMTYKGSVYLDGNRVVEHRLSPAFPMFP